MHRWKHILLLVVLAYEAIGCLVGGGLLITEPGGHLMAMPVSLMHGVFPDFLIPGIILFELGILNKIAFVMVFRRARSAWIWCCLALGGMAIWFWVEIAILQNLHWLHAMWGLPVVFAGYAAMPLVPGLVKQKALLFSGILASLLYAVVNVIVPMQWAEYTIASQTVSELSAIGAPTRMLWNVLCAPYTVLMIAFAAGTRKASLDNKRLRISAGLFMVYAALGIFWPFAPMHLRSTLAAGGGTLSDTLHLMLGAITEIIYFLALGFAATAFGRGFRIYSAMTLAALLLFGLLTFLDAPNVSAGKSTPFIGVWERINIGLFLLWVIVLSLILLGKLRIKIAAGTAGAAVGKLSI